MDTFSLAVGIGIGLGLAASGWTAAKIGALVEAKVKTLEAQAAAHVALATTISAVKLTATPAASPAAAPAAAS